MGKAVVSLTLAGVNCKEINDDFEELRILCNEIELLCGLEEDSILPVITLGDRNILRAEMPESTGIQSKLRPFYDRIIGYIRSLETDRGIAIRFAFQST